MGKKIGRPKKLTPEIKKDILRRIATSPATIRQIADEVGIAYQNLSAEIGRDGIFREQYVSAKARQYEMLLEERRQKRVDLQAYIKTGIDPKLAMALVTLDRNEAADEQWALMRLAPKRWGSGIDKAMESGSVTIQFTNMCKRPAPKKGEKQA